MSKAPRAGRETEADQTINKPTGTTPRQKTLEEYEKLLVKSNWGRPSSQRASGDKVFKGSSRDTPWNKDLLWKLYVEQEKHVLPQHKEVTAGEPPKAMRGKNPIYHTTSSELGPTPAWDKPVYRVEKKHNLKGDFTNSFRRGHKPAGFRTGLEKSKVHTALDPSVGGKTRILRNF
jgi:hypothetical protein